MQPQTEERTMKTRFHIFLAILLLAATFVPARAEVFKFTAIPDQDTTRLQQRFDKIAAYLSRELGIPVRYVPVKSYAASVEAFKNNQVQLAWFGGLSGVKARRAVPGALAIAQGAEDRHFVTYFIANAATGLKPAKNFPGQMAGKTFTFGSKGSTSGRLMPEFYIRQHFKKSPREVFRRVGFSGDHTKTIALVQAGSYEVGAVNFKVWETEMKDGRINPHKVMVIWQTPEYPDYNWTIRGDVDRTFGKGFVQKVQQALLEMKDPALLESFPRTAFIPADNTMYQPILDVGTQIGIFRK
jgi:phosphonate transport system substrate-binding protein